MSDRIFYVYQLRVNSDNLPFYIGKGKDARAWSHFKESQLRSSGNSHKNNKIKKAKRLGKTILVELLRENMTDKQSQRLEKYWIAKIGRYDLGLGPLTNMTNGGDGLSGRIVSIETRMRMSASGRGRTQTEEHANLRAQSSADTRRKNGNRSGYAHSEDTKRKMSESGKQAKALKRATDPNYGKKGKDAAIAKEKRRIERYNNAYNRVHALPKAKIPRKLSTSHIEALRLANTGSKRSQEAIDATSSLNRGQKRSDESRKLMSDNNGMRGVVPWRHPKTIISDKAIFAWSRANLMYSRYILGEGYVLMARFIGMMDYTTTHQNINKRFKSGWVPHEDTDWLDFKENYERVNR